MRPTCWTPKICIGSEHEPKSCTLKFIYPQSIAPYFFCLALGILCEIMEIKNGKVAQLAREKRPALIHGIFHQNDDQNGVTCMFCE